MPHAQIQDILKTRSAWDRQGELSARLKVDKLAAMFSGLDADTIQQLFIINKYEGVLWAGFINSIEEYCGLGFIK